MPSVLMHSAGRVPYGRVCARKNEENEEMKIKGTKLLIQKRLDVRANWEVGHTQYVTSQLLQIRF